MILTGSGNSSQGIPTTDLFNVVNPSTKIYTLSNTIEQGIEDVYWNNAWMMPGRDYTFDGINITIDVDILLYSGDTIFVKYTI